MRASLQRLPKWVYTVAYLALVGMVVLAILLLEPERAVGVSTGVLVLVTAFYAFQTQRMVAEMALARAEQVRPHVVLDVEKLGGGNVFLRVCNAGVGSAVGVDVRLSAEPGSLNIVYKAPVFAPGEGQSLIVRDSTGTVETDLRRLVHNLNYTLVLLTGRCQDALGKQHEVSDTLDLQDYADAFYSGFWRSPPDELKSIADQLKRIADAQ
jgi:hypothetical protein